MKKLLFFLLTLSSITLLCLSKKQLSVGDKAPDFELETQNNSTVHLSDFLGKKVALYFYPADNTPGCTQQACSLRDGFEALEDAHITILGISNGSIKNKKKISTKNHLNFPLLNATTAILKAYNVNHGLLYFLFGTPQRKTFLIDENGIIIAIIDNVDTKNHAQQIIDAFNAAL